MRRCDMAFCSNCGSELKDGEKFCSNCGAQISSNVVDNDITGKNEASYSEQAKPKKKKGRVVKVVLLIVAVLVVAAVAFIVWIANRDFPKDISKEKTNEVQMAGISFPISEAFIYSDEESSSDGEVYMTAGGKAMIALYSESTKGTDLSLIPDEDLKVLVDDNLDKTANEVLENAKKVDVKEIEVADLMSWTRAYQGTYRGIDAYFKAECIYNPVSMKLCGVYLVCTNAFKDKAVARYDKMLKSATAETVISSGTDNVSTSLKELLDEYEEFIDDYIDFMKKYKSNSGDVMGMLSDYTEIMQKYTDYMTKISTLDTGNMTPADYAYYLEVTTRVYKKLAEIE